MLYWGETKGALQHLSAAVARASTEAVSSLAWSITTLLDHAILHIEDLPSELEAEVRALLAFISSVTLISLSPTALNELKNTAHKVLSFYVNKRLIKLSQEWRSHVRAQLNKGGGKLFQYVSKIEKSYLNVDWNRDGEVDMSPQKSLSRQVDKWKELWAPQEMCLPVQSLRLN